MKLYLVTGQIRYTPYMGDTTSSYEMSLVWAENADQAEEKFRNHWENQSSNYSHHYFAEGINANEAIS